MMIDDDIYGDGLDGSAEGTDLPLGGTLGTEYPLSRDFIGTAPLSINFSPTNA